MPTEIPSCRGEYRWAQCLPVPTSLIATLRLPHYCSLSVSFGKEFRHQSLSLSLVRGVTATNRLTLTTLTHDGCTSEPAVTHDLLHLLLNTTTLLLTNHLPPKVTVSGILPGHLVIGEAPLTIPWQRWGFQPSPLRQNIRAYVRNLRSPLSPSLSGYFPTGIALHDMQWTTR